MLERGVQRGTQMSVSMFVFLSQVIIKKRKNYILCSTGTLYVMIDMLCLLVLSCTILPSRPSTSLIKARRRRCVRNNSRMLPSSSGQIAMRNAPKSTKHKHLYCRNLDRRQSTRNVSVRSYRTVTVRTDCNVIVCLGGFGANRFHTSKICVYVAL